MFYIVSLFGIFLPVLKLHTVFLSILRLLTFGTWKNGNLGQKWKKNKLGY